MTDILEQLKNERDEKRALIRSAQAAEHDLTLAIDAIEQHRISSAPTRNNEPLPRRPRGELQRSVLDCIRDGFGSCAAIQEELGRRGLITKNGNVSSTLYNLMKKNMIDVDDETNAYVIAPRVPIPPRENEIYKNDKGPSALTERPLYSNGEAGVHPA